MISKKEILKMVRNISKQSRGGIKRRTVNPQREWFIGIGLFLLVVGVGSVVNAQSHMHYLALDGQVDTTKRPIESYNREEAEHVIEFYTTRANAFTDLLGEVPVVPEDATTTEDTSINSSTDSEEDEDSGTIDISI